MRSDAQKIFSLAAVVVAAILFGMILSGGLNMTKGVDADRLEPVPAATSGGAALPDFADLADHVVPSVVSVYSDEVRDPSEDRGRMPNDPFHFFFGPRDEGREREPQVRRSSGSGFFITATGEIITNHHVIEDADKRASRDVPIWQLQSQIQALRNIARQAKARIVLFSRLRLPDRERLRHLLDLAQPGDRTVEQRIGSLAGQIAENLGERLPLDQGGHQGLMARSQAGYTYYMNIIFNCLTGSFLRCLKQRTYIYIKSEVCKTAGNDFHPPIVAIQTRFGDQHANSLVCHLCPPTDPARAPAHQSAGRQR